jgi:P pilus assembly chaperone PapD
MNIWTKSLLGASFVAAPLLAIPSAASAGVGDLLVAPTRVVLDGHKGAEVILNNIGDEPATYRVSVEFLRMTEQGGLAEVANPSDTDKKARDMIVYAPRKVTLAPHEPQAIRIAARAPEGMADGEYRVHMLFRAIPPATPVTDGANAQVKGVQFKLTPIYGVTIPVIVRLGNLQAVAGIAAVHLNQKDGSPFIDFDLVRNGTRSVYGEVRVLKAGLKDPIAIQKGIAVYTDVGKRHVSIPVQEKYKNQAIGSVTVQYVETFDEGSHVLAETRAVLR